MPTQNYQPNLGVYSAVAGIGQGLADVGKLGMIDAMETRRSKMENDLRMQLKGADQEFKTEQDTIENTRKVQAASDEDARKVSAAETKFGYDKELEGIKASGRAGSENNKIAGREMLSPGGQPVAMDQVRKLYADANGLNQEMIEWENVEPDFNKWAEKNGFTWKGAKPTAPPQPKSEADFKAYYSNAFPDASDEEYQQDLARDRASGLIAPAASPQTALPDQAEQQSAKMDKTEFNRLKRLADGGDREASVALYDYQQGYDKQEPGIMNSMDAMAGSLDPKAEAIAFAGGSQPGALSTMQETAEPAKQLVKPWKEATNKRKVEDERKGLSALKSNELRAKPADIEHRSKRAADKVMTAFKKGNLKTINKDRLRLALNNESFVNDLTIDQIIEIKEYLSAKK